MTKILKAFIIFEFKRLFFAKKRAVFLVFLAIALGFIQLGINEYKDSLTRKDIFRETEKTKVSKYINYRTYGVYGVKILFVPAPVSAFFMDSGVLPDTTSFVDSGERLNIYQPLQGNNIFKLPRKKSGFTGFSGFILFFGSLLALFYGFESFSNSEYLKFLSSFGNGIHLYLSIAISKFLVISLAIIILAICSLLLTFFNGIIVPLNLYFFSFLATLLLISLFFLSLGTVFSTKKSSYTAIGLILVVWFSILLLVPMLLNIIIEKESNNIIPIHKIELEKFKIFSNFEKKVKEDSVSYKYGEKLTNEARQYMLNYWNNEFKTLESLENQMRNEMDRHVSFAHWLSCLFPSTFYQSVTNELSSRGYGNLIDFYRYVQDLKHRFVQFYIRKVYFTNFSEVESFITGEENVYYASSRLPGPYFFGLFLTLLYTGIFLTISYKRFEKMLYSDPIKDVNKNEIDPVECSNSEYTVITVTGTDLSSRIYNILCGRKRPSVTGGFRGKIFLDDLDIVDIDSGQSFLYLCRPHHLPEDIKVKHFVEFIGRLSRHIRGGPESDFGSLRMYSDKTVGKLEMHERCRLLIELMARHKCKIYVVNDILKEMPVSSSLSLLNTMEKRSAEGCYVLFLNSVIGDPPIDPHHQIFYTNIMWKTRMNVLRSKIN
jgi:hypothetical protein